MNSFIRVAKYLFKYWFFVTIAITGTLVLSYLSGLLPLVSIRDPINIVLEQGQVDKLPYLLIIILTIYASRSVISFIVRYIRTYLVQKAIYDLRADVFNSLQEKSFSFYSKIQTGQLISRITNDVEAINRLYFFLLEGFVGPISMAIFSLYFLKDIDINLTLICAVSIPIVLLINDLFRRRLHPLWSQVREFWGQLSSIIQQNVVGIKVVRVFSKEDFEINKFNEVDKKLFDTNIKISNIGSIFMPLNGLIMGLVISAIYWYGGGEVVRNTITVGDLITFSRYIGMLLMPAQMLGQFVSQYSRAMVGAKRIFDTIDTEPDIIDTPGAIEISEIKGNVKFENVWFGYDKDKIILEDINLEVKAGETIAILGSTGSGKSTLINLIPRFYDVTKGELKIDGYDVRKISLKSLRSQIGIMLQDVYLFPTTIKENIAFGKPEVKIEDTITAAKLAQADEFIRSFPDGYNTVVGERGITLSGGQRQRIAIARTLLINPKILILDDSTSFVDTKTEELIQDALNVLLKGRTTFIITHRPSTIKNADRIVILEKGKITEIGTHEELLKLNKIYARIYRTQLAPKEELLGIEVT